MSSKNRVLGLTLFLLSVNYYSRKQKLLWRSLLHSQNHDTFVANNIVVGKVFDAVAERLNKPIILSKLAAQKK